MTFLKDKIISTISIWIINLLLIGILLVGVFTIFSAVRFFQPMEHVAHANGMKNYTNATTLNFIGYELRKELKCEREGKELFCETTLLLSLPNPLVYPMRVNGYKDDFEIRKQENVRASAEVKTVADKVSLKFSDKNDQFTIILVGIILFYISLAAVFLWFWFLRSILKNVSKREFFIPDNVRNFILLAVPLLVLPFLEQAINYYSKAYFMQNFQVMNGGIKHVFDLNIYSFVFGLVFLMMAGVIKEGIQIKEEQDLTI